MPCLVCCRRGACSVAASHFLFLFFTCQPTARPRSGQGMGEPLNNYDAVLASIQGMSDSRMFKLSPRHITLSTVGVVPRMKQLTKDAPDTQLALSLHAPNQASRVFDVLTDVLVFFRCWSSSRLPYLLRSTESRRKRVLPMTHRTLGW